MWIGHTLSISFGYLSTVAFLFVCIPQLYLNYKEKSTQALSFYLVYLWFIGDIISVISCKIKENSNIIVYIGYFHIFCNIIFLFQILYYRHVNHKDICITLLTSEYYTYTIRPLDQPVEDDATIRPNSVSEFRYQTLENYSSERNFHTQYNAFFKNVMLLFGPLELYLIIGSTIIVSIMNYISGPIVADILAWCSTMIFVLSRLPQIYLNYLRHSVEGLSVFAFSMLLFSNVCFLFSIVLELVDITSHQEQREYVLENLQWILGSSLSFFFDLILVYQFIFYKELVYYDTDSSE